ncbi:hypothetical protein A167_00656 [Alcanivorax sp. S71-1-4]|uniref:hypothetical protein n=1 Tax=Alcanivorax sp. S71-1-4 TaxID=1177159 RepID=UPI0013587137|nr:hypothetical protein [Alcanivorax sp. S71-1-4]KAF0810376.1 hypothetical protein A167_00656 [Alcanivorax sp. S71-1-4]
MRPLLLALLLLLSLNAQAELRTYVVETMNGESVVEVVRPMLPAGGSAVHYQGKLVLRTTPENYAEIRQVLEQVDTLPSTLRISLRRREDSQRSDSAVRGSGGVRYPGGLEGNVTIIREHEVLSGQQDYSISTLSGHEAFIDRGSLLAITGGWPASTTVLPLLQGLEVTPILLPTGEVRLSLQQRFDERQRDGQLTTQRSATTLVIPPGQWRSIGQLGGTEQRQQQGLSGVSQQSSEQSVPLQIRVDVVRP